MKGLILLWLAIIAIAVIAARPLARLIETTVAHMNNKAMQRALAAGKCIDIADCERTVAGDYLIPDFDPSKDYCDSSREAWVWSVARVMKPLPSKLADGTARTLEPGMHIASLGTRFYDPNGTNEAIECVWLR